MRRSRIFSVICAAGLSATVTTAFAAPSDTLEYPVKATFLYKFAAFVDWPPASFPAPTSPVNICVLGADPVAALVDEAARGQHIGERPISVRHLTAVEPGSGCHILYVAANFAGAAQTLDALHGAPVLTVADSSMAPGVPSIITFAVQENRVRFDIDEGMAAQDGLAISSKLLSLARTVRPRP